MCNINNNFIIKKINKKLNKIEKYTYYPNIILI